MSSKSRLWQFLINKGQATNAEIAEFMRGTKGQLSWGQRIRELRQELQAKGGDLTCQELKTGIYLYKIIKPELKTMGYKDTELEAAHRRNNGILEQLNLGL